MKFCQLSFYVWKWSLQTSLGKMTIDFSRFYSKICSKMSSCMIFLSIFPEANHARHIYLLTFAFLLTLSMSAVCLALHRCRGIFRFGRIIGTYTEAPSDGNVWKFCKSLEYLNAHGDLMFIFSKLITANIIVIYIKVPNFPIFKYYKFAVVFSSKKALVAKYMIINATVILDLLYFQWKMAALRLSIIT